MAMRRHYSLPGRTSSLRVRYNVAMIGGSNPVFNFIESVYNGMLNGFPEIVLAVNKLFGFLVGVSFALSLFFFIGIIYCVEQLKRIRRKEADMYDLKVEPAFEDVTTGDMAMANRWENAVKHVSSNNPNDWKQAILEADIMLDNLLTRLGYKGESVGEKLKRVNPGDMKSLNDAWEAHKVRNQIAHEGSNFSLEHHVAKQVINRYRKTFEEFYYI